MQDRDISFASTAPTHTSNRFGIQADYNRLPLFPCSLCRLEMPRTYLSTTFLQLRTKSSPDLEKRTRSNKVDDVST